MEIIHSCLTDGTPVCIRRVRPDDQSRLKAGIASLTAKSRYFRFFTGMREAPQSVVDRLVDVDGHSHVAWGALRSDLAETPALGVVHAFREEAVPGTAEFSVAVIDEYHGRGLARILTAVLLLDCRREGYDRLLGHVLSENVPAQSFATSLGARWVGRDMAVRTFEIDIEAAITALHRGSGVGGLEPILAHFRQGPDPIVPERDSSPKS